MFPEWTWILGIFIGAAIGSFLNVCIYRLPRGLSLSKPPNSFCPNCKHKLGIPDLVPLFSWLFLRARCRYCKEPIASRYFIVELMNGAIWGGLWWQYLVVESNPAKGIAYALFGSALLVAFVTDLEHYVIPDEINAFLLVFGVGYHAMFGNVMDAVFGALVGWGLLWGVAFLGRVAFGKDAMGHGDIKMARGLGAMLGPVLVIAAFFIAVPSGLIGSIVHMSLRPKQATATGAGVGTGLPVISGDLPKSEPPEEEDYEPESVGSLLKCGLGYLLLVDVIALFAPKVGVSWFGEEEMAEDEIDDWTPQGTAIPFGPYLALGAVASALFAIPLTKLINDYFNPAGGQPAAVEHRVSTGGHRVG